MLNNEENLFFDNNNFGEGLENEFTRDERSGCGCGSSRERSRQSSTDLLCRANRAAEISSTRILREACEDFRGDRCGGRNNKSSTDILCRLNSEAERASSRILRETCDEFGCGRNRCHEGQHRNNWNNWNNCNNCNNWDQWNNWNQWNQWNQWGQWNQWNQQSWGCNQDDGLWILILIFFCFCGGPGFFFF